ncbi:hypothetical protein DFH07DRAFT_815778 [Mycena maculata]|uniref:Uncharacterized protein n=1 Tax=Mycena maculata TaxID=230809 RepID=A0AAD7NHZ6_9AGAR|nr:hypothetical protein DFH07DRAFT_815778 [Mycena maculata]
MFSLSARSQLPLISLQINFPFLLLIRPSSSFLWFQFDQCISSPVSLRCSFLSSSQVCALHPIQIFSIPYYVASTRY